MVLYVYYVDRCVCDGYMPASLCVLMKARRAFWTTRHWCPMRNTPCNPSVEPSTSILVYSLAPYVPRSLVYSLLSLALFPEVSKKSLICSIHALIPCFLSCRHFTTSRSQWVPMLPGPLFECTTLYAPWSTQTQCGVRDQWRRSRASLSFGAGMAMS